MKKNKEIKKM